MEMPEAVFSLQPYAALHARMAKKSKTVAPLSKKIKTAAPKDRRRPLSLFQRYDKPINPENLYKKKLRSFVDFVQFFFLFSIDVCVCVCVL